MTTTSKENKTSLSYDDLVDYIRAKWGIDTTDEISVYTGISQYQVLEIVLKENIKTKFRMTGLKFWEKYEVDFITNHSFELTTGKAAEILLRSRYAVYMKAKSLGLSSMIKGK